MLHSEKPKFDYNKRFGEVEEGGGVTKRGGPPDGTKEVTFQSVSKSVMQAKYPSNMKRSP
jgi:hypothetical protein